MYVHEAYLPTLKASSRRQRELLWTVVACLGLTLGITVTVLLQARPKIAGSSITATAYRKELQAEVQMSNGAPANGRDPALQVQTSLAQAGSMEDDIGKRVLKPAAKVVGTVRHTNPTSVLPNVKQTHMLASGCLLGYGVPGAQCVPAKAPKNQPLNCNFLRTIFPQGVQIQGPDYLQLGKGTAIACGTGAAVLNSSK